MGVIGKNEDGSVRLPPIAGRKGSRGNVMSVDSSFSESPRKHPFSEIP